MDPTDAYRNKIGERLTIRLAKAIKDQEISVDEYPEVSSYILENIDKATSNSELFQFLEDIAKKWPIFSDVSAGEQAEVAQKDTQEKVEEVKNLINENKIDDALKAATDANNKQGGES